MQRTASGCLCIQTGRRYQSEGAAIHVLEDTAVIPSEVGESQGGARVIAETLEARQVKYNGVKAAFLVRLQPRICLQKIFMSVCSYCRRLKREKNQSLHRTTGPETFWFDNTVTTGKNNTTLSV